MSSVENTQPPNHYAAARATMCNTISYISGLHAGSEQEAEHSFRYHAKQVRDSFAYSALQRLIPYVEQAAQLDIPTEQLAQEQTEPASEYNRRLALSHAAAIGIPYAHAVLGKAMFDPDVALATEFASIGTPSSQPVELGGVLDPSQELAVLTNVISATDKGSKLQLNGLNPVTTKAEKTMHLPTSAEKRLLRTGVLFILGATHQTMVKSLSATRLNGREITVEDFNI